MSTKTARAGETMFEMYTIEDVHKRIPKDAGVTLPDFKRLVEHHGTYRQVGAKGRVMLEDDVRMLFQCISVRRAKPAPPPPDAAGLIVFIGHPTENEAPMLVAWSPVGMELSLLDRVKEFAQERVMVMATADATPRDVEEFMAAHKKGKLAAWRYGSWFARTDRFMASLNHMTDEGDVETDEPEVSEDVGGTGEEARRPKPN